MTNRSDIPLRLRAMRRDDRDAQGATRHRNMALKEANHFRINPSSTERCSNLAYYGIC
jgi:hypothetical protein